MNKLTKVIAAFLAVLVISLLIALSSMGFIIRKTINSVGPSITGTHVNLISAKLSLLSGSAGMDQLTVANPKGFKNDFAFQMEHANIKLQAGSISTDTVVIEEIIIDGMELSWEGLNGENIKQIQLNIETFTAKEAAREAEANEVGGAEKPKGFIVKKFLMTNTKIKPVIYGFEADLIIPEVLLENIGNEQEHASLVSIVDKVVESLEKASSQMISASFAQLKDDIKKEIKKQEKQLKEQTKELEESGKSILKGEKSIDSAINSLKSIKLK